MAKTIALANGTRMRRPFEVKSRDVWMIAVPASFAFITEPLVGLVDIAVIGRLGDPNLLGGLVLGALVFDFIFALAQFLRLGTAGLTAQAVGANDPHEGLIHIARAIGLAVVIGMLMIALAGPLLMAANFLLAPSTQIAGALAVYFHVRIWSAPFELINYALLGWFYGRAAARTGMALQILIHGLNIVLNLFFVLGLGMGVAGAALGTVLAQAVAALVGLYLLVRHFGGVSKFLALVIPAELVDAIAIRRMFTLSRDIMIRSAALMTTYAFFAGQGSRAGDIVLSGNAILLNILMVSSFFLDGLAQAAEQLCGKAVGANWQPAFERAMVLSLGLGVVIAGALTVFWLLAGGFAIDIMTTNAPIRAEARLFLPLAALCTFLGMPAFVMDGVVNGATLNVLMRNGMVASLALFLVAVFALAGPLGNTGLWLALIGFFVARGIVFWWAVARRKASLFS